MRVLVTGGAGFLGSHICDALAVLPEVELLAVVDNLSSGRASNLEHLHDLRNRRTPHLGLRIITADVSEARALYVLGSFDLIVHAASPASPPDHMRDAWATISANLLGAKNCTDHLDAGGRMVFLSTSEVYGDPEVSPQQEDYRGRVSCTGPRAPYDEGKRVTEALLSNMHPRAPEVRIARLFNTYGPRMRPGDGRVVSNFICQALRGEDITIYGDGRQRRSLCWYEDTIAGILRLALTDGIAGRWPINIGNPEEITVQALAEYVLGEVHDSRSRIAHQDALVDDPSNRCPDITRAGVALGWGPVVSWRDGVSRTIDWFRHLHDKGEI